MARSLIFQLGEAALCLHPMVQKTGTSNSAVYSLNVLSYLLQITSSTIVMLCHYAGESDI